MLRQPSHDQGRWRRVTIAAAIVIAVAGAPRAANAQGLFDFLFGEPQQQRAKQRPQQREAEPPPIADFFADPFGLNPQPAPTRPAAASAGSGGGSGPAFCVRSCDGKYFPLMARSGATPAQICQAFCPAAPTRVFLGSSIDGAVASNGERYADSDNAFAYRKALKPECTCNGRSSAGLAPVDLSFDTSLRPGDVIATANGLVAYSGSRAGNNQTTEFTPVASYPGLTTEVRSRLGEMKVAPVSAELIDRATPAEAAAEPAPTPAPTPRTPNTGAPKAKRADIRSGDLAPVNVPQ